MSFFHSRFTQLCIKFVVSVCWKCKGILENFRLFVYYLDMWAYHVGVRKLCWARDWQGWALNRSMFTVPQDDRCPNQTANDNRSGQNRGEEQGGGTNSSRLQRRLVINIMSGLHSWDHGRGTNLVLYGKFVIMQTRGQHKIKMNAENYVHVLYKRICIKESNFRI